MDTNNWRPPPGGEPAMDAGDWRSQLQADSRPRIVNKIMDALKRHLPFSGQEGLQELKKIADRFEEEIYTAATSQSDYLRKISLKMLTLESISQNTMGNNTLPSNSSGNSNRAPDPGGEPAMDAGDWRSQLQADSRERIVNKIMDTLKRHLPFYGQEGLQELKKIADGFEEKIYTTATSQSDYLRKISLKMLTMESISQNTMGNNTLPSNSAGNSNRAPDPGGEPAMDAGDWRNRLQADSRQRIVNKIMDKLKRHLPFSGQEGLQELKKIADRFEEKIYTAATSQSDYLRKISVKMLTMESKSQNTMGNNTLPSNSAGNSNRAPDSEGD